jgi:hypothetical protein
MSLRVQRRSLAFFREIVTLACRGASAGKHACAPKRHSGVQVRIFSRFSRDPNDKSPKGVPFLNPGLGWIFLRSRHRGSERVQNVP